MKKLNYLFILLTLPLTTLANGHFDDGLSHTEDFLFDDNSSSHNYVIVDNSQLTTNIITVGTGKWDTHIQVSNDGVIKADIIANKTNGSSFLNINNSKQPNQFTLHNNSHINESDQESSASFNVDIQSSDAKFQIFNNGKYSETIFAPLVNPDNPNIINLKHYFYGDSQSKIRWGNSDITGDIVLSDNAYAYYDAFLRGKFTGNITLHDTSHFDFAFIGVNNGNSYASTVNADILINDNATANFMFGDENWLKNISKAVLNGNMVVSDNAIGNVLTKTWGGIWNGNLITKDNAKGQYHIEREDNPQANSNIWNGDAIARDNSTIQIALEQGSMWTGRAYKYDNASIDVSLNDASSGRVGAKWLMTENSEVNSLASHDGQVYLSLPTTDFTKFNTLTTDRLSGDGTFFFNTNIARNQGDVLIANTVDTGSQFLLDVNNQAGVYTKAYQDLLLVKTQQSDSNAFTLAHNVEVGGYEYTLAQNGGDWYLTSPDYKPSSTLKTAIGNAFTNYILDITTKDLLIQRQGDLRINQNLPGNVWVKTNLGRINHVKSDNGLLGNVNINYNHFQMGVDKKLEKNNIYVGITSGYVKSSQDHLKGNGNTTGYNVGAYFTSLMTDNLYVNLVGLYNHYTNSFNTLDTADDTITANNDSFSLSSSAEIGYKMNVSNKFYVEPYAQLIYSRFSSNSISASNDLKIDIKKYHSLIGKLGFNVGVTAFDNRNTQLYLKTYLNNEFLANINVIANDVSDSDNFKNMWGTSGLGVTSEPLKDHHIYAEAKFDYGGKFKNTSINLGYLFMF